MNTFLKKREYNRGLVRAIVVIVIALLIISYFGFNIRAIVNSPAGHENFTYVQELIYNVWNNYLKGPVTYLWHDIFLNLIWYPAIQNLTKIKNGDASSIQTSAPVLPMTQPIPN